MIRRITALAAVAYLAACDSAPTSPLSPDAVSALKVAITERHYTPNPEEDYPRKWPFVAPTLMVDTRVSFTASGKQGAIDVTRSSVQKVGATMQITQTWSIVPGAAWATPLTVTLRGVMDARTGAVQLDGTAADGTRVRVKGQAAIGANGPGRTAGEVMFNPQPDPPREQFAH